MSRKGAIVLMGSGELTATMVEVHKEMLGRLGSCPQAVFLDTPAGFQLNADHISAKAVEYFRDRIGQPLAVASFKSAASSAAIESEKAYQTLRQADFILVGPGSPTYAIRQWSSSPIPDIIARRIEEGACFVAASAAALTAGRFTLPVYEIYKVGEEPRWVEGIDILGRFDFNLAVVPHWNNAEGGTHDTRFCFLGEPRFRILESLLPAGVNILGLDEHTACIIDLMRDEARIRGAGSVTLCRGGSEHIFSKNDIVPLAFFRDKSGGRDKQRPMELIGIQAPKVPPEPFWDHVHFLESIFERALETRDLERMAAAILQLDLAIWEIAHRSESLGTISHAREILRAQIARMGTPFPSAPRTQPDCLRPLVEEILKLRAELRHQKRWADADLLRESLQRVNILVEDTDEGVRWRFGGQD
jgi:peptidase E